MTANIKEIWLTDSGATCHITPRREWFTEYTTIDPIDVRQGDGSIKKGVGIGKILVKRYVQGRWIDGWIDDVLHVPLYEKNLFSTNVCTRKGLRVVFDEDCVQLEHKETKKIVAEGQKYHGDICCLFLRVVTPEANLCGSSLETLHKTLAHVNKETIKKMVRVEAVKGVDHVNNEEFFCEGCQYGKMHRQSHKKSATNDEDFGVGECIYMDLCGPMTNSLGGARYFMLIKDRRSAYRHVYFLSSKYCAFDRFKEFCEFIATNHNKKVKRLRVDNGGEFINARFKAYLTAKGIHLATSAPYCPHQNGRIERENRTVVEAARTMLLDKLLPKILWAEAVNTAVYTLNRTLLTTSNSKVTPYEQWHGRKPYIGHMHPFGTPAFAFVHDNFRRKFDAKSIKTILVGYQDECKNYRLYDQSKRKVIITCHVNFNTLANKTTDVVIKIGSECPDYIQPVDEEQQQKNQLEKADDRNEQPEENMDVDNVSDHEPQQNESLD